MGQHGKGLSLAFFLIAIYFSAVPPLAGQSAEQDFPLIVRLDSRDDSFKQYIADVESNRRRVFSRDRTRENATAFADSLTIYRYVPREGEDLLSVAARCSMPYSALATLNRLGNPSMITAGSPLLLPSVPGLFVPEEPVTDLEQLLAAARLSTPETDSVALTIGGGQGRRVFYFFPGAEFGPTERAFFLNRGFRFPLRSFRLTSGFGMRRNPVTGSMRLHEGMDFAAPLGSEVYAAGDGIVTEIGNDPVYGTYMVIKHEGNWASLYGHLQKTAITLRSTVKSGMLIGWVGNTGQSTGPHLHFELRQNGKAQDPDKHLFLPGGQ